MAIFSFKRILNHVTKGLKIFVGSGNVLTPSSASSTTPPTHGSPPATPADPGGSLPPILPALEVAPFMEHFEEWLLPTVTPDPEPPLVETLTDVANPNKALAFKLLGKGAQGRIRLVYVHRRYCVLKTVRKGTLAGAYAPRESRYNARLRNSNQSAWGAGMVALFYQTYQSQRDFHMLMPLYTRTLAGLVGEVFSPTDIRIWTLDMLAALRFLHSNAIIHRDIKPENVLQDWNGRLAICDFDLAICIVEDRHEPRWPGTPVYMAPEVVWNHIHPDHPQECGFAVDIFALGCVLYELVQGRELFEFDDSFEELSQCHDAPVIYAHIFSKDCSPGWEPYRVDVACESLPTLVALMLEVDPDDRVTLDQCIRDEFFMNVAPEDWCNMAVGDNALPEAFQSPDPRRGVLLKAPPSLFYPKQRQRWFDREFNWAVVIPPVALSANDPVHWHAQSAIGSTTFSHSLSSRASPVNEELHVEISDEILDDDLYDDSEETLAFDASEDSEGAPDPCLSISTPVVPSRSTIVTEPRASRKHKWKKALRRLIRPFQKKVPAR